MKQYLVTKNAVYKKGIRIKPWRKMIVEANTHKKTLNKAGFKNPYLVRGYDNYFYVYNKEPTIGGIIGSIEIVTENTNIKNAEVII